MARNSKGRNDDKNIKKGQKQSVSDNDMRNDQTKDDLGRDAEQERTRKPGSQSNSSNRANSGRGGGK